MKYQFIESNPRPRELNESNDCTVRATAIALDKDYKEVHSYYASKGRKPRRGCVIATVKAVCSELAENFSPMQYIHEPTVSQFIRENPTGHWVVIKRGHAFAIKNGVVYDMHKSCAGAKSRVKFAFKVKD